VPAIFSEHHSCSVNRSGVCSFLRTMDMHGRHFADDAHDQGEAAFKISSNQQRIIRRRARGRSGLMFE
jgi:hypothetical protein